MPLTETRSNERPPGPHPASRVQFDAGYSRVIEVTAVLEIGAASDAIQATASSPLLETNTASLKQVIDCRQVVSMPLNARNSYAIHIC